MARMSTDDEVNYGLQNYRGQDMEHTVVFWYITDCYKNN